MDKKGTDKIISVYWFAILFIVAAAIVYMVYVFYGGAYDIRDAEANIMMNRIADCITAGNELDYNINNGNFLSECHLTLNTTLENELNGQYYVEVPSLNVVQGNKNLNDYCGKKGDKLPKCYERDFYTLNQREVKIKVVINKVNKNA